MRYAIYGIGGFGREIAPLAADNAEDWESAALPDGDRKGCPVVFVDDAENCPSEVNGIPVISFDQLASDQHRDRKVIVAIGDGRTRERIEKKCLAAGLSIGNLASRTSRNLAENQISECLIRKFVKSDSALRSCA